MMNHESKQRPVTLEDLLRLKRTERPSAEFWTQFDRELRAKQLAALVEKRPWWSAVPRAFAGLSRYHVPIGATAILALTIVSVREFRSVSPVPAAVRIARAETGAVSASNKSSAVRSREIEPTSMASTALVNDRGPEVRASTVAFNDGAAGPADAAQSPAVGESVSAAESEAVAPKILPNLLEGASRLSVNNLVALNETQPAFSRDLLGASRGFETRAMPASKPKVDPLMQLTSPATTRHASLLNASFTGNSVGSTTRISTSRGTRRLSTEQFNDSASRFVASGNTFATKF